MATPKTPAPIRYEMLPSISTKDIALSGLFEKRTYSQVAFSSCGVEYLIERIAEEEILIFHRISQGKYLVQNIICYYHTSGPLEKLRFICPKTNRRCAQLFLLNNIWASREAHGLRARGGTVEQQRRKKDLNLFDEVITAFRTPGVHQSTKNAAIEKLNKRLERNPVVPNPLLGLEDAVLEAASHNLKVRRQRVRSEHPSRLSLAGVLQRSHSLAGSVEAVIFTAAGEKNSADRVIAKVNKTLRPIRAQETHFCLDVKSLLAAGLLDAGKAKSELLDFYGICPPADRAVLKVDLTAGKSEITIAFMTNEAVITRTQIIKIRERSNRPNRFFLECPINSTCHDKLFLRDGIFASANGQRLKTLSQL